MRALVVGQSFTPSLLAAVRGLGTAGWYTGVGAADRSSLASASRFCTNVHVIPTPEGHLDGFIQAVTSAVDADQYEVVFGTGDAEVLTLSAERKKIRALVPYGPHYSLMRAFDKLELATVAESVGLRSPRLVEATPESVQSFGPQAIVKSRLHWRPQVNDSGARIEAQLAVGRADILARVENVRSSGGTPLLQEPVAGRLMALTTLFCPRRGAIASTQHVSSHLWPPGRGVPTRSISTAIDKHLLRRVSSLLAALHWEGLANLQFIQPAAGDPYVIDFNGRFYVTMALASAAGVNFADLWARTATGRGVVGVADGGAGYRYHWLEGDIRRALVEREGGLIRDLATSVPRHVGAVGPIYSGNDLGPVVRYLVESFKRTLRYSRKRLRANNSRCPFILPGIVHLLRQKRAGTTHSACLARMFRQ